MKYVSFINTALLDTATIYIICNNFLFILWLGYIH